MGIFVGRANVTGDASGGFVELSFARPPTAVARHVYFVEGVMFFHNTDPGNLSLVLHPHWPLPNIALDSGAFSVVVDTLSDGSSFHAASPLATDMIRRTPLFNQNIGDVSATALQFAVVQYQTNTNTQVAQIAIWGRYYDRAILDSRDFGSLLEERAAVG